MLTVTIGQPKVTKQHNTSHVHGYSHVYSTGGGEIFQAKKKMQKEQKRDEIVLKNG